MDRVVVTGGAAIEREPVAGYPWKRLADDAIADRRLVSDHDGLALRTTTVREMSAT